MPLLIADFQRKGIQPTTCIVGEPTEMMPVVAHKGINSFRCRLHGHAAHSSLTPKGCNAIEYGAKLICWLRDFAEQFKENGFKDDLYDVPYTTLTSTMVSAGIAMNTIPSFLEFLFEFRNLPHDNQLVMCLAIAYQFFRLYVNSRFFWEDGLWVKAPFAPLTAKLQTLNGNQFRVFFPGRILQTLVLPVLW